MQGDLSLTFFWPVSPRKGCDTILTPVTSRPGDPNNPRAADSMSGYRKEHFSNMEDCKWMSHGKACSV